MLILGCPIACGETANPVESLNKGLELSKPKGMAVAVIELKNVLQGTPDNTEIRRTLGKASLGIGDAEGVLKEFNSTRLFGAAAEVALTSNGSSGA